MLKTMDDLIKDGEDFLQHHGIKGQKWGVRNGPPYPLGSDVSMGKRLKKRILKNTRKIDRLQRRNNKKSSERLLSKISEKEKQLYDDVYKFLKNDNRFGDIYFDKKTKKYQRDQLDKVFRKIEDTEDLSWRPEWLSSYVDKNFKKYKRLASMALYEVGLEKSMGAIRNMTKKEREDLLFDRAEYYIRNRNDFIPDDLDKKYDMDYFERSFNTKLITESNDYFEFESEKIFDKRYKNLKYPSYRWKTKEDGLRLLNEFKRKEKEYNEVFRNSSSNLESWVAYRRSEDAWNAWQDLEDELRNGKRVPKG